MSVSNLKILWITLTPSFSLINCCRTDTKLVNVLAKAPQARCTRSLIWGNPAQTLLSSSLKIIPFCKRRHLSSKKLIRFRIRLRGFLLKERWQSTKTKPLPLRVSSNSAISLYQIVVKTSVMRPSQKPKYYNLARAFWKFWNVCILADMYTTTSKWIIC